MKYHLLHTTTYEYTDPVSLCHNLVHLSPRSGPHQKCHQEEWHIDPEPGSRQSFHDFFGNRVATFTIEKPHRHLQIIAQSQVEVEPHPKVNLQESMPWEKARDSLRTNHSRPTLEAVQFLFDSYYVKASEDLAEYARPSFPPGQPILQGACDLTRRIHQEFKYDSLATTLATPLHEVLEQRRGVCQDFAHLQIGCLRSLGLPSRYVSGYVLTKPPPGKPRLVGADASHAWISVYCPDQGWLDFDPTNNLIPVETHITLAWGRDYDDVSPIKGVILGGLSHSMTVSVHVEPVV
jgi:transglutaminase-like putative cysteine protease